MPTDVFTNTDRFGDLDSWHAEVDELRATSSVHLVDQSANGFRPFWAVVTHAGVMDVERRSKMFTNGPEAVLFQSAIIEERVAMGANISTLVNMDGEQHLAYRGLTADQFKPAVLNRLQDSLDQLSVELMARMEAAGGACDFASDEAFGFGAHFCLGAQLAKMELRTVYGDLVPRLASLELDSKPVNTKAIFVGGVRHLPIRYELLPA